MTATPQGIPCPVCQGALAIRFARGRKSGKPFVSLVCPQDGRHFRGFIGDKDFIQGFVDSSLKLEGWGRSRGTE